MNSKRELLRHTVATVAYRGGKAVRDAPDTFGVFTIGESPKTPAHILAHIGQLAMLRRLGVKMRGENYFKADIVAGRVGLNPNPTCSQPAPKLLRS